MTDSCTVSKGDICYVWRYVQCSTIETFISCELLWSVGSSRVRLEFDPALINNIYHPPLLSRPDCEVQCSQLGPACCYLDLRRRNSDCRPPYHVAVGVCKGAVRGAGRQVYDEIEIVYVVVWSGAGLTPVVICKYSQSWTEGSEASWELLRHNWELCSGERLGPARSLS